MAISQLYIVFFLNILFNIFEIAFTTELFSYSILSGTTIQKIKNKF